MTTEELIKYYKEFERETDILTKFCVLVSLADAARNEGYEAAMKEVDEEEKVGYNVKGPFG